MAELKRQLEELQGGNLPEYSKRLRRLEGTQKERVRVNAVIKELEEEMVEQDFVNEKKASAREYEEHKVSVGHICRSYSWVMKLDDFYRDVHHVVSSIG